MYLCKTLRVRYLWDGETRVWIFKILFNVQNTGAWTQKTKLIMFSKLIHLNFDLKNQLFFIK